MINLREVIRTIKISAYNVYENFTTAASSVKAIENSWEGSDHDAFQVAYIELDKKIQRVHEQYSSLQGQLSSLQSSIDAAERDKQNKKMQKGH